MAYPDVFITQVLDSTDLGELIEARVVLKRTGKEYKGLCPFHNERTPSFTVAPSKGFYHCFGCGAHGDAIDWLTKYEKMEWRDAVAHLADKSFIPLPPDDDEFVPGFNARPLIEVNQAALFWYMEQLKSDNRALSYLHKRGVTDEQIQKFQIGYAPAHYDLDHLGFSRDVLESSGLIGDGKTSPWFFDRIIFPMRDARNRLTGFSGRRLGEFGPKYINTQETQLFKKGETVFSCGHGFQRKVGLVEGFMDVMALDRMDMYGAAACGTAVTHEQARALFRIFDDICLMFDGDSAGRKASEAAVRVFVTCLNTSRRIQIVSLEGGDPADMLENGEGDKLLSMYNSPVSFSEYLLNKYSGSPEDKAKGAEEVKEILDLMPQSSYKEEIVKMMMGEGMVLSRPERQKTPSQPRRLAPLDAMLAMLLSNPELAKAPEIEFSVLNEFDQELIMLLREGHNAAGVMRIWEGDDQKTKELERLCLLRVESEPVAEQVLACYYEHVKTYMNSIGDEITPELFQIARKALSYDPSERNT